MTGAPILLAAASLLVALTGVSDVRLTDRNVRLRDVAVVSGPAAELRFLVIARLADGRTVKLSRAKLAELVRRAVPGARVVGDGGDAVIIHPVARSSQRPGSKPYVAEAPAIARGQALTLAATTGPVLIQRPVVALQSARKGDKRLFVRTGEGTVLSAPLQIGAVH